jgi:signal transduction histidine kinase
MRVGHVLPEGRGRAAGAQGTCRHPRRPVRAAGSILRRPAAIRCQRVTRAAYPLTRERSLLQVTRAALGAARPAISRLGLHVQTDIQPAALDGDPLLIQQLATNLIDNAIRHNIPGGDNPSVRSRL